MRPLGAIVVLKHGVHKLMIIGRQIKTAENRVYDYVGVLYPEGFAGSEFIFLFDEADIREICFSGLEKDPDNIRFLEESKNGWFS